MRVYNERGGGLPPNVRSEGDEQNVPDLQKAPPGTLRRQTRGQAGEKGGKGRPKEETELAKHHSDITMTRRCLAESSLPNPDPSALNDGEGARKLTDDVFLSQRTLQQFENGR